MLSTATVEEVQRLVALEKFSLRQIAKLVGVSRGSVGSIASGRRPDYQERPREQDENVTVPRGPLIRCPGCGGRVYSPCRLCRIRALKKQERQRVRDRAAGLVRSVGAACEWPRQASASSGVGNRLIPGDVSRR